MRHLNTRSIAVKVAFTVAVAVVAAIVTSITSLALFTDQETVGSNTFGTGTVDLTTAPTSAVVTMPSMDPGDQVTAAITVSNSGSLDLRYSMSSTTTDDVLASELIFSIKAGVTVCDDTGFGLSGTTLYSGVLGTTGTIALLGSNTAGADPGDRTLTAGTAEVLCMNVSLPLATTNASQGLSTASTFTFDAEQTRNN